MGASNDRIRTRYPERFAEHKNVNEKREDEQRGRLELEGSHMRNCTICSSGRLRDRRRMDGMEMAETQRLLALLNVRLNCTRLVRNHSHSASADVRPHLRGVWRLLHRPVPALGIPVRIVAA
eukprot:TRINITY_DN23480_c0_g1_i1.p3 TRINITY_DN23480_c0_g1~~TRINITY_DN23480_c0_g1_i1.p3  ORF type:complete len:122 (+),score=7.91 TRINITY_DN23480_c0_g1_i1:13-378(+)